MGLPGTAELEELHLGRGMSLAEISRKYDVSPSLMSRHCWRLGIEVRRAGGRRPGPGDLESMLESAGVAGTAVRLGVKARTVRRWMRRYGLRDRD